PPATAFDLLSLHDALPIYDGADVGEVDVDQARADDQVGDALHRAEQHVVGGAEGLDHGRIATQHGDQLLVGDGDQRIAMLAEFLDRKSTRLNSSHVKISYA